MSRGAMKCLVVTLCLAALVLPGCIRFGPEGVERSAPARAFWSFLLPGAGQLMTGEPEGRRKAVLLLALDIANFATADQDDDNDRVAAVAGVVHLWSAVDAYEMTVRLNEQKPLPNMANPRAASSSSEPYLCLYADYANEGLGLALNYRF